MTPPHAGARGWLEQVLDPGTFTSWDTPPERPETGSDRDTEDYQAELTRAHRRSGADEAVLTGRGAIEGRAVAVVVSEFGFLGGSIGVASADRIVAAIDRATAEALPLIAAPASGGTRMQEGTAAFVQMIPITDAVAAHRAAGLPYLVHLRHPTTGGVLASWASLGDVTVAEPGAMIGFLGPRVVEALAGAGLAAGTQTAEALAAHGHIDAVGAAGEFRSLATRALDILAPATPLRVPLLAEDGEHPFPGAAATAPSVVSGWSAVTRTRRPERVGTDELLAAAGPHLPLRGTGSAPLVVALARVARRPCVLLGHRHTGLPVEAGDLAAAHHGLRTARALNLPVITVIDTSGAALSAEAETSGLASRLAALLSELIAVPTPTIAVLLGQGAGGAALTLLPTDRVLAAENAWLAPLPPEGASALVHHTPDRAPEIADSFGITAADLHARGVVDHVLAEPGASRPDDELIPRLVALLGRQLAELVAENGEIRRHARHRRFRRYGRPAPDDARPHRTSASAGPETPRGSVADDRS